MPARQAQPQQQPEQQLHRADSVSSVSSVDDPMTGGASVQAGHKQMSKAEERRRSQRAKLKKAKAEETAGIVSEMFHEQQQKDAPLSEQVKPPTEHVHEGEQPVKQPLKHQQVQPVDHQGLPLQPTGHQPSPNRQVLYGHPHSMQGQYYPGHTQQRPQWEQYQGKYDSW